MFHLDLRTLSKSVRVTLEIDNGELIATSPSLCLSRRRQRRSEPLHADYKEAWNAISGSPELAKLAVAGNVDEALLMRAGEATVETLQETVGVRSDDVMLEIGCGVGRVGAALAPLCKKWIGTDASENMCEHAAARLSQHGNVEVVPINGWDLAGIPSASVDVAYSTVVFMHIDEWDGSRT